MDINERLLPVLNLAVQWPPLLSTCWVPRYFWYATNVYDVHGKGKRVRLPTCVVTVSALHACTSRAHRCYLRCDFYTTLFNMLLIWASNRPFGPSTRTQPVWPTATRTTTCSRFGQPNTTSTLTHSSVLFISYPQFSLVHFQNT